MFKFLKLKSGGDLYSLTCGQVHWLWLCTLSLFLITTVLMQKSETEQSAKALVNFCKLLLQTIILVVIDTIYSYGTINMKLMHQECILFACYIITSVYLVQN